MHVACAPTTPDPACGLSIRIKHTKTCLQTQTWTEGLSTQTQHPQSFLWIQTETQHPKPTTPDSVDSTLRPSTSDPTCGLSRCLCRQQPDPVTRSSSPDPSCGRGAQSQHSRPCLQTGTQHPVAGCPHSRLPGTCLVRCGAVLLGSAAQQVRAARHGAAGSGRAQRSPAVRGPAVPSRTEPCRTAPCRPAVRGGGGRGAQPRPGATQHGSRGGARAGAARRGPGSGLPLRRVCPAHAGGQAAAFLSAEPRQRPPRRRDGQHTVRGVFAQHGQVG